MIEIKKIDNKSAATAVIAKFNLIAHSEDIVMGVFQGVDIVGAGALSLWGTKVYLSDLKMDSENDNITMLLSLARSLLFHADLKGIKAIYVRNKDIFHVCKLLKFKESGEELALDLEGFFTSECE